MTHSLERKRYRFNDFKGLLFISPWLFGFLLFQLYPFISSFCYSFTDYNGMAKPDFVGAANYIRMFTVDPDFLKSLGVTALYALISVPSKLVFALFVAVILNWNLKGVHFFRTIYYIPSILGGSIAVSALWKLMFMKSGIVNGLLGLVGIPALDWLGHPALALITISLLQVWQFGSSMVLFLAALKQIPTELYEAARVDGSSRARIFFRITLPMITPILFFNIVMQSINALQNFTSAFVITNGGPMKATYLIGLKLYLDGFSNFKMGYASAISWILFAIILLLTALVFRSSKFWVHYDDGGKF